MPRSLFSSAFSSSGIMFFSQGEITSVRASSTLMDATWFNGRGIAVVLHLDAIEQARVGTAGANAGEVGAEHFQGFTHALVRVLFNFHRSFP